MKAHFLKPIFHILILCSLLAVLFGAPAATPAQAAQPIRPLMTVNAWNALGSGLGATTFAIAISGTDVYAGGSFTSAGGVSGADRIAKWDGNVWQALGSGIDNGQVNAIAFDGTKVYVGGTFTNVGGDPNADYIIQWDGSSWSALGNGLNNTVQAIGVSGSNIYVSGSFTNAGGDAAADYIAKLDGGSWVALGATPLTGAVDALVVAGATVYASGSFSGGVAMWDGTSWTLLGGGLNSSVFTIALVGSDLYAGGLFSNAGGNPSADRIAKWDGSSWSALGSGLPGTVIAIAISGSNVYAGGGFFDAGGDVNADKIARWDGTSWSALGTTPLNSISSVTAITISGLNLYAGGSFTSAGGVSGADRIARFDIDSIAPTVDSFTATSPTNSLNIPITAFTASDNIAVSGYKITESSTPPAASAAGWTASAPGTYTVASSGSYTLYPWVKDGSANVSAVYGSPATVTVDASAPTVDSFTATSPSTSLDIPITTFTASDNIGVTGYIITESSTPPSAGSGGWTGSAPTSYTVASSGSYTLYPWAKDALGNVSTVYGSPASVSVDNTAPTVTEFSVPSSSSLDIPITTFTASDNIGVTGYLITETSTPPSAGDTGWTGSAPATYTVASTGSYTLYPWAKDALGNVSAVYGSPASVSVDNTAPTVTDFSVPSSSSLDIPITTFTASDNIGVTGYKITETSTPPSAGDTGWTGSAPTSYTVASSGAYTLYPWAKDAVGNISDVYGSPASVSVDNAAPTVTDFSVPSSSTSLDIPITTFTASDNIGVTGYKITETSTPPSADAIGWMGSTPSNYTVTSSGSYNLYPWAKDATGNVSAVYGSLAAVTACVPGPITVTSSADSGAGTLRQAIAAACAGATINFNSSLSGDTIFLASTLTLSKNVTINGAALASQITISGDSDNNGTGNVRVLLINTGVTVTLDSLVITKGINSSGGGIRSSGMLTVTNSTFSGNSSGGGGGIFNSGGTLTVTNSTFSGNSVTGGAGGGIRSSGTLMVTNSTFSGNSATGRGGGIEHNTGTLTVTNSTFSGNSASTGGSIFTNGGTIHYANTIIANSPSGGDCVNTGTIVTNTNNLVEDNTCSPSLSGDPNLGSLASNGGPTQTIALLPGSIAINAGDNTTCTVSPISNLDQRGIARPNGPHCDIGAYEYVDNSAPTIVSFTVTSSTNSLNIPITAFSASDDVAVAGYLITESSTPPLAGDANWTASAPTSYTVSGGGSYSLYPWAKDALDNVSAVYGSPASVTVDVTGPTVDSFAVTSPTSNLAIPITAFTASDDIGVTGYKITESSALPSAGDSGWMASAPTEYTVASSGSYTLYPWAKDAIGNVSAVYSSPAAVTVCVSGPITVTSSADSGAGSLRQAIADACAGATIDFAPALSGATIHLASTLTISKNLTIDGSALASQITISGDSNDDGTGDVGVFHIDSNKTVSLNSLVITKGAASSVGGGIYIVLGGTLTITNSTFSDNSAYDGGGGIFTNGGSTLTIIDSTFSGNSTAGTGGGVYTNGDMLTITNSTFSGNSADSIGGGIFADGTLTITNSTFSGNSADFFGGGIQSEGTLTITNSTFSGNSAVSFGGGIANSGTLNIANTIIANSPAGGDCINIGNGTLGTNTGNLVEDNTCSPSLFGDPKLAPLANNGGSTQTFALLVGSPAINAGDDTTCAASPVSNLDQRGVTRPNGLHCDIGAYEYVTPATATPTPTATRTKTATPTRTSTPTITRTPTPRAVTITLTSVAAQDGWVLESSETSSIGGSINSSATTFNLGDHASKQQYRGILSFKTSSIPDNATITGLTLKVKKRVVVGSGNPVTILKGFMIDIKTGFFGTLAALQPLDFQAAASKILGPTSPALTGGFYNLNLLNGKTYINKLATKGGLTQIRLRFKLDDNNNAIANYLSLYSGNAPAASRPQLIITYTTP